MTPTLAGVRMPDGSIRHYSIENEPTWESARNAVLEVEPNARTVLVLLRNTQ